MNFPVGVVVSIASFLLTNSTPFAVNRSTNSTTVACTATLPEGGSQAYTITLVRDGLGWKVSDVQLSFDSQSSATSGTTTTTGTVATGSDASSDAGSTGASDTSTAGSNAATPTN